MVRDSCGWSSLLYGFDVTPEPDGRVLLGVVVLERSRRGYRLGLTCHRATDIPASSAPVEEAFFLTVRL